LALVAEPRVELTVVVPVVVEVAEVVVVLVVAWASSIP